MIIIGWQDSFQLDWWCALPFTAHHIIYVLALQAVEKLCSEASSSFESFNRLLRREVNGQETETKPPLDPRLDAESGVPAPTVELKIEEKQPSETTSVKILERCGNAVVNLHMQDGNFWLHTNSDVLIPKGTKLCSVGSGRMVEGGDGKIKVNFSLGDKTLIECSVNGSDSSDSQPPLKGSAYTVLKQLQKNNSTSQLTMTGHRARPGATGFNIEATGPQWSFQPSAEKPDKADKPLKTTVQNIATWINSFRFVLIAMCCKGYINR